MPTIISEACETHEDLYSFFKANTDIYFEDLIPVIMDTDSGCLITGRHRQKILITWSEVDPARWMVTIKRIDP